jgi:hypothetical protein
MSAITNSPDERTLSDHVFGIRRVESRLIGDRLPTIMATMGKPPRSNADRTTDIIEMGHRLTELQRIAGPKWLPLLRSECWSDEYIRPYMNICAWHARYVGDSIKSGDSKVWDFDLDPQDIFLLADPSTPEAARAAVVQRAGDGETLDHATVMAIIRRAKAKERKIRRS